MQEVICDSIVGLEHAETESEALSPLHPSPKNKRQQWQNMDSSTLLDSSSTSPLVMVSYNYTLPTTMQLPS